MHILFYNFFESVRVKRLNSRELCLRAFLQSRGLALLMMVVGHFCY